MFLHGIVSVSSGFLFFCLLWFVVGVGSFPQRLGHPQASGLCLGVRPEKPGGLVHCRLRTVMEGPRTVTVPGGFTPGAWCLLMETGNPHPGKGSVYPVPAALQGNGEGPGAHSSAQAALSCALPHSLLCLGSASVELLFIFPRDYAPGLFEDKVVANLGVWSAIWVYYLYFIYLFIEMNSYRLHIIQITYSLNHLRESCWHDVAFEYCSS